MKHSIYKLIALSVVFVAVTSQALASSITPWALTGGGSAKDVVIDPAGNLYVANVGTANVTKITPAGSASILGVTGSGPQGIAIDSAGNVYTANNNVNTVTKITPAGVSSTLGTTGSSPIDLVVDSLGNVYVSNLGSNTITQITPAGVSTVFAAVPNFALAITIDSADNLYVTDSNTNTVTKITPAGVVSTLGTTGNFPIALAVDSADNVYAVNQNSNNVTKITPAGVSTTLGTVGNTPKSITLDTLGNVYVTNSGDDTVTKITPAGVSTTLGTTGDGAEGVAVDAAGNVYAVYFVGNGVTRITRPTSTPELSEVTPVSSPTIDFTPSYTFEALVETPNTIAYGGSCGSLTTTAVFGNNTINFNFLPNGTYSDCTITVTDAFGTSNVLAVTPFTINNTCTYGPNGAENLCNGLDDDCDGSIDENWNSSSCVAGVGICEFGETACAAGVESCVPYASPAPESCNGVDDDCDGTVDNGGNALCDDSNACTDDVCSGALGCEVDPVAGTYLGCIGSSCVAIPSNSSVCVDSAGCTAPGDTCTCVPTGESEGICNGADDDCDGSVDEDFTSAACTSGLGVCEVAGNSQCLGGVESCDAVALPAGTEVCDGLDNNCDGTADETATDPELGDTLCDDSDTCTYDYCNGAFGGCSHNPRTYHYECSGTACVQIVYNPGDTCFASSCSPSNPSTCGCVPTGISEDICNGVDDNCDGNIDESFLGVDCVGGLGICTNGTSQCTAGVISCQPDSGPFPETCDGLDNDCDGTVDNGGSALCDDGNSCTGNVCSTDGNGATSCHFDATPGTYFACVGSSCVPVPNNTNSCTNLDGCTAPGDSCTCTPNYPGNTYDGSCNGVDDDCDGLVDEDWTTSSCSAGIGACLASGTTTCSAGVETCDAVPGSPQPIICDFTDQDCNGVFDNDQPAADATCDDGDPCTIDSCAGAGDGGAGCHNDVITYHYECIGIACTQVFNMAGMCPADGCNPLTLGSCGGSVCGDGTVDPDGFDDIAGNADDEQCDDSNITPGDGCNATCKIEACGNSVLDAGEACDDGNLTAGDGCSATCALESCGNGITEGTEQCDDANLVNTDSCTNLCLLPVCGDSFIQAGEFCDDGNVANGDGCNSLCALESCGDGTIQPGETCDDSNNTSNDGCSATCTLESCGDGITQASEQCDDANLVNTDACTNFCLLPVCGDSFIQPGEQCDDSNTNPNDGCSATCQNEVCGNGLVEGLEQCDDGNAVNTDACTNVCTTPICGDSIVNGTDQCDDANLINTDSCTNTCTLPVCGDSFLQAGEACDDGNLTAGDGCSATCALESCGNGITDPGEQCDDANLVNTDGCTNACTTPVCGDGFVQAGEQCDDANLVNTDACTNSCLFTIDLSLSKTVSNPTPTVGTNVTFTITISNNSGSGTATGVTVQDILPSGYSLVSTTLSAGSFAAPTWTVGSLAPAQSETLSIVATVLGSGTYTNYTQVMTATGTDIDSTPGNDVGNTPNEDDEDDMSTAPVALPTCGDGNLDPGETCDDSNTTSNDGCSATCQTESCGDGITQASEQCDDANAVNTDACTNACTLPVCGDGITNGTEACDDGNLSNIDTCTILCILTADPGITKTVDNPNPDLDGIISYFITVTNNGPSIATGVVVTDVLPPGLTLQTANVTAGVLTLPTWTLASMAPFTTETLTITASVDVTNPITNIATVTSTSPDIDPLNNQDQVTITPQSATVQGHLFRDDNENQLQDPGEANLPNISVRITDRNAFLRIAVTDTNGDYTSIIPPGSATLEIDASDPDFPDDYIITVDTLIRSITALPGINPVHFFGIDIPDTVTTKNTKDKKKRSITVTLQRTLVATGIPLEAGAALGYFSLLAITALSLRKTRRY